MHSNRAMEATYHYLNKLIKEIKFHFPLKCVDFCMFFAASLLGFEDQILTESGRCATSTKLPTFASRVGISTSVEISSPKSTLVVIIPQLDEYV